MKLRILFVALFSLAGSLDASLPPIKPNIVFILADDLGWSDLGCYGGNFHETPNLDALSKQGMRFTDAYAAGCVCSPTRACIITGQYPARLRLTDWLPGRGNKADQKLNEPDFLSALPPGDFTLAKALKAGGYRTAFIGKWHLGDSPDCWPEFHGFDLNIAGCSHGHPPSYFSPYGLPNLTDGPRGEYLNDRLTDEALKFIGNSTGKPFFLYLSHYAVHLPLQAKPDDVGKYRKKAEGLSLKQPEYITDHGVEVQQHQKNPVYGAMVGSLDESVGRILSKLQELGLETNTIVIFSSDNGGLASPAPAPASNLPLRGGKGWAYEGGIREPLIIRWPGVTQPSSVSKSPVSSVDFYPTLLEMAGLSVPKKYQLDGESIVMALKGKEEGSERPLFWHYPHYSNQGGSPYGAVRFGDLKLIEWYEDMKTELYNLKKDPGEHHDLTAMMPEKSLELKELLHSWRLRTKAQMPTQNLNYDPKAAKGGSKKTTPQDA